MTVAIDGPAGSGKGTVASRVAKELNLMYIDSGATYRCVALKALRDCIDLNDKDKLIDISSKINVTFGPNNEVYLDGEDVSRDIRTKEVTSIVSGISSIVKLRENLVNMQKRLAGNNDVIMEGRDITTVVFPDADFKFYLDAAAEERAKRRFEQNKEKNIEMSYEEILENIKVRDYNDSHKEIGSLMRTDDQIYIDSTNMTIDEVVNKMIEVIKGGK